MFPTQKTAAEVGYLSVGVLDEAGVATPLFVDLRYTHYAQAAKTKYLFSVLLREPYDIQRVYQLEVRGNHELRCDVGTLAEIETPFKYEDGDDILGYVEFGQGFVRFFDDGEVYDHFAGRGLFSGENYDLGFLSEIAAANGLRFNDECIIEIAATPQDAPAAFAKFMAAMLAFVSWDTAWATRVAELRLAVAGK